MKDFVSDVASLESCVGKVSAAVNMKVIDHLDDGARRWIAASPFLFAAFGGVDGVRITASGGEPGRVRVIDPKRFKLSLASLDDPHSARKGSGFAALFLTPSIGETLRVNGRVLAVADDEIEILVEECYVHCAKALIRSNFWNASPEPDVPEEASDFLAASRFLALATTNAQGDTDISPKGDPSGAMIRIEQDSVWYADRPGNRRMDSFRNILEQPAIAAAALIPGSNRMVILSGVVRISTAAPMRACFSVEGKTPHLVTCIEEPSMIIRESPALIRAGLWPAAPRADGIDPAAMFVAHVKLSKAGGLQAKLVRTVLSVPRLMEIGLQHDYKNNLY
jgi:uncharacterized protein